MTIKDDYIKRAVLGDEDYHEIMRFFARNDLIKRAARVVENTGEIALPHLNHVHWQTNEVIMNVGQLWCFHAVDVCGHYGSNDAHRIWRYGQVIKALRFADNFCEHAEWLCSVVRNCGDYCHLEKSGDYRISDAFYDKIFADFGIIWIKSADIMVDENDDEVDFPELHQTIIAAILLIKYVYLSTQWMTTLQKKMLYSILRRGGR